MTEISKLKEGSYALCWYPDQYNKLELFFCKIIKLGSEYATCELYWGETLDTKKVRGIFKDVCVSDISMTDNLPEVCDHTVAAWGNMINLSEYLQKKKEFNEAVNYFNEIGNRKAEPHPGFLHKFKYCGKCGQSVENIIKNLDNDKN